MLAACFSIDGGDTATDPGNDGGTMTRFDARPRLVVLVATLAVLAVFAPLAPAGAAAGTADAGSTDDAQETDAASEDLYVGTIEPGEVTRTSLILEPPENESWTVEDVYVTGTDGGAFFVDSGGGSFTLESGEQREIVIGFSADELGVKNATLVVDERDAPIEISISGDVVENTSSGDAVTTTDFGEVPVGETVTRSVTIPAPDDRDITVTASLIGEDAGEYRIVSGGGTFTIPAGETHDITVAYTPEAEGSSFAQIELVPEDDTFDPKYVDLTGEGVTDGGGGSVTVSTTELSFPEVPVDRLGADVIRVDNDGTDPVDLSVSATTDGPGQLFLETSTITVQPGSSTFLPVVFSPETRDRTVGRVTLDGPALDSPIEVSVSGTGGPPTASDRSIAFLTRNMTVRTATVDGVSSVPVIVRNNASEPIDLSSGELSAPFSIVDGGGTVSLDPGEIHAIYVQYDPETTDPVSDVLRVSRPATGETLDVGITGIVDDSSSTSDPPEISLSASDIDFGTVTVGERYNRTVTVTNDGSETIEVAAGNATSPYAVANGDPVTVAPGESRAVTVTFAPDSSGSATGSMTVLAANDAGTVERTVGLSGVGSDPDIDVTLGRDRLTADDPTTTLTIANRGEGPLVVDELTLPGPFSARVDRPLTVAAGDERTITVRFDTSVDTNVTSTVRIGSNDVDESVVRRTIQGVPESPTASVAVDGRTTEDDQVVNATVTDVEDDSTVAVNTSTGADESERVGVDEIAVGVDDGESFTLNVTTGDRNLSSSPTFNLSDGTRDVGYVSVDHSVPDENIRNVSFTFTVPDERIPVNESTGELKPEAVALYRYVDDEWVELDTAPIERLDGAWRYQGVSPGLSEFAIGGKEPKFRIDRAEVNVTAATIGDNVAVRVLITNVGGADGIFDVQLFENEELVDSRQPTVPPNGTVRIVFLRSYEEAGDYRIDVNDRTVDTVSVESDDDPTTEDDDTTTGDDTTNDSETGTTAGDPAAAGPSGSNGGDGGIPIVPVLAIGFVVTAAAGVAYSRFGSSGSDSDEAASMDDLAEAGPGGAVEVSDGDDEEWSEWADWEEETNTTGDRAGTGDERTGSGGAESADHRPADGGHGDHERDGRDSRDSRNSGSDDR